MTSKALINPTAPIAAMFGSLLTFLEKISDEDIWKHVLGERLVNLLQKYFGNDFVTLSLAFYLAPILRTHWAKLMGKLFKKVQPAGTVAIKIYNDDELYRIISKYAFQYSKNKRTFVEGIAEYYNYNESISTCVNEYDDWKEYYSDEKRCAQIEEGEYKVKLKPPKSFDEEIIYKGHTIKIEFKGASDTDSEDFEAEHIIISMEGNSTKQLHYILQDWSDEFNSTQTQRYVYKPTGNCWTDDRELPYRDLNSIHLRNGQKENLIMDLKTFKSRANWYKSRGIPYRRGYLLYGPPGTGKSSTIQAVAAFLDYNIAIISSIASTSNETFCELIRCVPFNTIIVIEDVDHLFKSASSSKVNSKMTMSGLLNVMDGVNSHNGSIIFMTCNNMVKLEPALLRPGRIDVKLHLDYAAPEQVEETFWRFMGCDDTEESLPLPEEEKEKAKKHCIEFLKLIPDNEITTAELQSFFIDLLLEANAEKWDRDHTYEVMYERVPGFLTKVQIDRDQAAKHEERENSEKEEES